MAAPIGPGDLVECLDAALQSLGFVVGNCYEVHDVAEFDQPCAGCFGVRCHQMGLRLCEITPVVEGHLVGWVCADSFRPLDRRVTDLIHSLTAPPITAPVRETENA